MASTISSRVTPFSIARPRAGSGPWVVPPGWGGAGLDGLAAVDDHRVPDGEGGLVRAEPEHRRGDLLRATETADRFLGDDGRVALLGAAGEAPDHLGVDDPGADGVDADALRRLLEGGRGGQADHG